MTEPIIGHQKVVQALRSYLPQVTLLYGPEGVGKRTLALSLAESWQPYQVRTYLEEFRSVDAASISQLCEIEDDRLFIIDLDHAGDGALNDLLRLLEEPPLRVTFILLASKSLPLTIYSRAAEFYMGYLSYDDLWEILVEHCNLSHLAASGVAHAGTVVEALRLHFTLHQKGIILSVLQAVEAGNRDLFHQAYKSVDEDAVILFLDGLFEAVTENWNIYEQEQLGRFFSNRKVANIVLKQIGVMDNPTSPLSLRIVLEPMIGRLK